jgi:hypothetical protein
LVASVTALRRPGSASVAVSVVDSLRRFLASGVLSKLDAGAAKDCDECCRLVDAAAAAAMSSCSVVQ